MSQDTNQQQEVQYDEAYWENEIERLHDAKQCLRTAWAVLQSMQDAAKNELTKFSSESEEV